MLVACIKTGTIIAVLSETKVKIMCKVYCIVFVMHILYVHVYIHVCTSDMMYRSDIISIPSDSFNENQHFLNNYEYYKSN